MIFYIHTAKDDNVEKIIKEKIIGFSIFDEKSKEATYLTIKNEEESNIFKEILEDETIKKTGINLTKTYILLKQIGINLKGINYDIAIASYILNPTNNKLEIENLLEQYLEINSQEFIRRRTQTTTNKPI